MHTIYIWSEQNYLYTVAKKENKKIIYVEVCSGQRLVDLIQARKKRPLRVVAKHASSVKHLNGLIKDIKVSISGIEYLPLRDWENELLRLRQPDYNGPEENAIATTKKRPYANSLTFCLLGVIISLVISYYHIVTPFLDVHSLSLDRRLNDATAALQYLDSQVSASILWDAILIHYPESVIEHIEVDHLGNFSVIFLNPVGDLHVVEKYNFFDMVLEQGQRIQGSGEIVYIIYVLTGRSLW